MTPPAARAAAPLRRVAILTRSLEAGYGVDLVVREQASRLARAGHAVGVFTLRGRGTLGSVGFAVRCGDEPRALLAELGSGRWDAVIAHTSPFFELLPELAEPVATVAWEHGDPDPALFRRRGRIERQRVKDFKRLLVYPAVHAVVAVSHFVARDIGWPRARVVYNGADHLVARAGDAESSVAAGAPIRLLSVGRMAPLETRYKGTFELIELQRRLGPGYEVCAAGRGEDGTPARLAAAGLRVRTDLSQGELIAAYRECDAFVSLSRWEGFNLPLVEAQSFGRPAFALDRGAHAEVTPHVFADVAALADRLASLDREALRRLGAQARSSSARFAWRDHACATERAISDAIEAHRGAGLPRRRLARPAARLRYAALHRARQTGLLR